MDIGLSTCYTLYLYLIPLNSDNLQIYVLLGDMPFILLLKYNDGWRHEKGCFIMTLVPSFYVVMGKAYFI